MAAIGCGSGEALVRLARRYPASTLHGFDADQASIIAARRNAARSGVSARVTFEAFVPGPGERNGYDVILRLPRARTRPEGR